MHGAALPSIRCQGDSVYRNHSEASFPHVPLMLPTSTRTLFHTQTFDAAAFIRPAGVGPVHYSPEGEKLPRFLLQLENTEGAGATPSPIASAKVTLAIMSGNLDSGPTPGGVGDTGLRATCGRSSAQTRFWSPDPTDELRPDHASGSTEAPTTTRQMAAL